MRSIALLNIESLLPHFLGEGGAKALFACSFTAVSVVRGLRDWLLLDSSSPRTVDCTSLLVSICASALTFAACLTGSTSNGFVEPPTPNKRPTPL